MLEGNTNPKTGQPIIPSLAALKKISDALGISITQLLVEVDDIPIDLLQEMPATISDDGLTSEFIRSFEALSPDKQEQAMQFLRFLSSEGSAAP
jgi:hypothetical protein